MIWFACKKCGKRHGRAESLYGTMVFCECGFGNRVPAASTVAEPDPEESPAPVPLPLPRPSARRSSTPVPFLDEDEPPRRRSDEPLPPPYRPRPRKEPRRINAKYCLNHDETPTEHTCAQCRMPFCSKCVLTLQGEVLCGPCKNFKVRGMQRPSRLTPLSIVAVVVGMVSGPVSFCLTLIGIGMHAQGAGIVTVFFGVVALLLPAGGLVMSFWALNEIENKPRVGGRMLAMTGTVASLVGALWSVTIIMVLIMKAVEAR
jgi:hypothetical protein